MCIRGSRYFDDLKNMGFVEYGLTVIEKMAEPFTCFDRFFSDYRQYNREHENARKRVFLKTTVNSAFSSASNRKTVISNSAINVPPDITAVDTLPRCLVDNRDEHIRHKECEILAVMNHSVISYSNGKRSTDDSECDFARHG